MNNIKILYEDNHLLVVIKPHNMLVQGDASKDEDMLTILKNYLKNKYNKPGNVYLGLVHRLDRPVGGIMVFAKTSKSAARLSEQIRNKTFKKNYYALVHGYLDKKEGTFVDNYEKIGNKKILFDTANSKQAILEYKVVSEKNNLSLVDIHLITGRYHQIRLQFSKRNHPLYGDNLYGKKEKVHIFLFAYKLSFIHPTTKELLNFKYVPQEKLWQEYIK